MSQQRPLTILCLASYEKGQEFMRECKRQGCRVVLVTSESIANANWPRESIDDFFLMPDVQNKWNRNDVIYGVSFLARHQVFDRIVALDDFDVETAAALREHLRIPGMGDTTARYFRDKLAMRVKAKDGGIRVPEFVHVLNHEKLKEFMSRVPPPWVVKPRFEASAVGIKKISSPDELWPILDKLGDRQSFHVMEQFIAGDVFHVDSLITDKEVVFSIASKYGHPPMTVAHGGGVFTSQTMVRGSEDEQRLLQANRDVMRGLGMVRGVSHTEFIKGRDDGEFYFLETASRVGGANIVELVEAATGFNLWAEWAKIEITQGTDDYQVPDHHEYNAGLLISLAKQEHPDLKAYNDPEIWWRLSKQYHVGLIVRSDDPNRVSHLLDEYSRRVQQDFLAVAPLPERPVC
ncbi:MAG: ATPase [Blastocatellia bacterium]|nr:ATPase [Blastocatellia bacterium]